MDGVAVVGYCLQAKYRGTIVTVESFREWKMKFEDEMREKRGSRPREETTTRLTGRAGGNPSIRA